MSQNGKSGKDYPRFTMPNTVYVTGTVSQHTTRPTSQEVLAKIKGFYENRRKAMRETNSDDVINLTFDDDNSLGGTSN